MVSILQRFLEVVYKIDNRLDSTSYLLDRVLITLMKNVVVIYCIHNVLYAFQNGGRRPKLS